MGYFLDLDCLDLDCLDLDCLDLDCLDRDCLDLDCLDLDCLDLDCLDLDCLDLDCLDLDCRDLDFLLWLFLPLPEDWEQSTITFLSLKKLQQTVAWTQRFWCLTWTRPEYLTMSGDG